jgi:hypothetical protein
MIRYAALSSVATLVSGSRGSCFTLCIGSPGKGSPWYDSRSHKRCVCGLATHWQSPCLVVRCSEQKYTLDGKGEHKSTKALRTRHEELAKTKKSKKQDTNKAKQDEAKRCAIQHALDILPRIKQYVMVLVVRTCKRGLLGIGIYS